MIFGQHARELISTELSLYFLNFLCRGHITDKQDIPAEGRYHNNRLGNA